MTSSDRADGSPSAKPVAGSRRNRQHVTTFGIGRVCVEPTCKTTLSRYNGDDLCWRHAEARDTALLRRP